MPRLNMTEQQWRERDNAYTEHGRLQTLERQIKLRNLELELNKTLESGQPSSRKQSSGNKGPRKGTLASFDALHIYLFDEGHDPTMRAPELARLATDYAIKLGLSDTDLLDPKGSTMLAVAARLLKVHRRESK